MMVKIGTRIVPVNIAFSSSRNAALIECKVLQYTTLSIKLQHCTLSEIKTPVFTLSDILAWLSLHCVDQKQHSNPDVLTKSINNTLQTCVDLANEYLQTYNTGAGVKNLAFCSLHQCERVGYAMLLFAFVLSKIFEKKSFYIEVGQNNVRWRNRK